MKNSVLLAAIAGVSVTAWSPSAFANDPFDLYVKNIDHQPVTITLSNENNNCFETDAKQLGEVFENVAPGKQVLIHAWKKSGHGCNGVQGEFELVFNPGVGVKTTQHFDYDSDGGLELTNGPGHPNPYPGKFTDNGNHRYTYTTFENPVVTVVGAPLGSWKLICEQICNRNITNQITKEHNTTHTLSEETTRSITASLESGLEFKDVGGIKGKIETAEEHKVGRQMAEEFRNGETQIDASNYVFTPEQMKAFNIFAIWQWIATTQLSDGQQIMIGSNKFSCTSDARAPDYFPGSKDDIGACTGALKHN